MLKRNSVMVGFLGAIFVLLLSNQAHAFAPKSISSRRADSAVSILSAFQSGCSSIGAWTGAARAQSTSLITLIDILRETSACKPFQSQLLAISTLSQQVQTLVSDPALVSYRAKQEELQQYTLLLMQTTDPAEIIKLKDRIFLTQIELAQTRADYNANQDISNASKYATQSANLASYMTSLLTQTNSMASSPSLDDCLRQEPSAGIQLGMNLLAYGGSFISPVYGAGAAVLAQLISIGVENVRNAPYHDGVFRAYEDQMPLALSCALESMSSLYCAADDSYRLIELESKNYDSHAVPSKMWRGLDLLGRRFPDFSRWLEQVKNGIPPSDPTQAAKQIAAKLKVFQVDTQNLSTIGDINGTIGFYREANNQSTKNKFIQTLVSNEALLLSRNGSPFTTFENNPYKWACWFVKGYGQEASCEPMPNPGVSTNIVADVNDWVSKVLIPNVSDDIVSKLLNNWASAVEKVQIYVNIEFSKTITTNAAALLAAAFERLRANAMSPYETLGDTAIFIQEILDNGIGNNPRLQSLLLERKQQIERARWYLSADDQESRTWFGVKEVICPNDPSAPMSHEDCNRYRLTKLFELFSLKDGVQVFATDINYFVTWDLQRRLQSGEFPPDVQDIFRTAGIDIAIRMQAAGLRETDPIKDDLNNARRLVQRNISNFRTLFKSGFQKTIMNLYSETSGEPEAGPNRPSGELLGRLCTLWLVSADQPLRGQVMQNWPDSTTEKICKQATLYSINSKPIAGSDHYTLSLNVDQLVEELQGKTFRERVCAYHQYQRKIRIAELMKDAGLSEFYNGLREEEKPKSLRGSTGFEIWMRGVGLE